MLQALERLSGPRRVLLGGSALLIAASLLPWYHYAVRGLTLELSGWHEIGVLAWILAVDVVVWELVRAARIAPIGGDRGDRYSAVGGLATAFVGTLFVLRRGIDGDLGYGWIAGVVLVAGVGLAGWNLFISSKGPEAIAARLGRGEAPEETRPDDGRPAPERPAPATNWRRTDWQSATVQGAAGGVGAAGWSTTRGRPADPAPAASLGLGPGRSAVESSPPPAPERARPAPMADMPRGRPVGAASEDRAVAPRERRPDGSRQAPASPRQEAPAWSSIDEPDLPRRERSARRGAGPAWQTADEPPRRREDLPPWRGGPRSADPGGERTRAWEAAVERDEDLPPWRRPQELPAPRPVPERHSPRVPWRDRRASGDGDELPPWRGGGRRKDPPGGRPAWRGPGGASASPAGDRRPSPDEKQRKQPPLW